MEKKEVSLQTNYIKYRRFINEKDEIYSRSALYAARFRKLWN